MQLDNQTARKLWLHQQALTRPLNAPFSNQDLHDLIVQLGYVQLDSIRTIERAHHMILWSRADKYHPDQLTALHEEEHTLFEHWTHDACLIPTQFYPHWRHRFDHAKQNRAARWEKRLGPEGDKIISQVRARVKKEGALMTRDFEDKGKGAWWGWGPSKTALEYLWRSGEFTISHRKGFQKAYALSKGIIPEGLRTAKPTKAETLDWKCRQALTRLGVANAREIAAFWQSYKPAVVSKWIEDNDADLMHVEITSADKTAPHKAVAFRGLAERLEHVPKPSSRLRFLSPFDPLIRDRDRLKRLFNFDYKIEIFVPEKKRKYGYYVLPILEGSKFTGRVDLKMDRKTSTLQMKGVWWEEGVRQTPARTKAFDQELARLAKFLGAENIVHL